LRGAEDYLDLDWSPRPLELAAAIAGLPADAIRTACSGGSEVNAAYRDVADTIWEHPVTALDPSEVVDIAARLGRFPIADVVAGLPASKRAALAQLGMEEGWDEHPRDYLGRHYEALRRFYVVAAERGLATAMWWD
jgi:hypothetical protein